MDRFATLGVLALALLPPGVAAETLWLRGRGPDVWIERDGQIQEPQRNRKGFTRVASPRPSRRWAYRDARVPRSLSSGGVGIGPAYRSDRWHAYAPAQRRRYRDGDSSAYRRRHDRASHHHSHSHRQRVHPGDRRHRAMGHGRGHAKPHHGGRGFGRRQRSRH